MEPAGTTGPVRRNIPEPATLPHVARTPRGDREAFGLARQQVAIIGGGLVGLATAWALAERLAENVLLLEAEDRLAAHQSGRNSGVIHSGLYYRPGSVKATTCVAGRDALYRLCAEHAIPHERCGKLVVAVDDGELGRLAELERRGRANGLDGLERLAGGELAGYEPRVRGVAGLWVPQTGIVDYRRVAATLARLAGERGARLETGCRLLAVRPDGGGRRLETTGGEFRCRLLVNCAGLHSDRVARLCGHRPGVRIVPFRGEYYRLTEARAGWVRNLIYPVPDPRFPFLGVHFTRRIDGMVEAGPNAVPALARHGYSWRRISPADCFDTLRFGGFWRLAARHWRTGIGEIRRSLSRRAFVAELRRLLPELTPADVEPAGSGVRAQAVAADGSLVDDFLIEEQQGAVHVLNAPSPAATASLAIGSRVATLAFERLAAG